ncbi:MAG TPA: hypothetical protein PKE45_15155 [Caldilineaceae bacterium]|nr:hypothetical protein [Caldilineaceae bacterium]
MSIETRTIESPHTLQQTPHDYGFWTPEAQAIAWLIGFIVLFRLLVACLFVILRLNIWEFMR